MRQEDQEYLDYLVDLEDHQKGLSDQVDLGHLADLRCLVDLDLPWDLEGQWDLEVPKDPVSR